MPRIIQRPRAVDDLVGIWTYIARHNVGAADRTLGEIERVIRLSADFPLIGRSRPELMSGLRSFVSATI